MGGSDPLRFVFPRLVLILVTTAARAGAISNTLVDLGTLGGASSVGQAVNDTGQVVGWADTGSGEVHAFRWSSGAMADLGTLGGQSSYARGINAAGDVVGAAAIAGEVSRPFLYTGGVMSDLGSLGGGAGAAYDINDSGDIVGQAYTPAGVWHAFLYSGGTMTDLGTFGGQVSEAHGVNAAGDVVGFSDSSADGRWHAFLYSGGTLTDLGTFGVGSTASAINASGLVMGWDEPQYGPRRAFTWSAGTKTSLGPPLRWTEAFDVNDSGQIVGRSYAVVVGVQDVRAFIQSGGTMADLNDFVPSGSSLVLREAHGISNAGHVTGIATVGDDFTPHAFLLTFGPGCGNGLLDAGEDCDDGDTDAGDGCSAACALEPGWQCDGQPSLCRMTDRPIDGIKVVLRSDYTGERVGKAVFVSKDPNALFPVPGSTDDPTLVGAAVDLFSSSGSATFLLPASGWTVNANGTTFSFVNSPAPVGISAVRVAKLRQGRLLRITAKDSGLVLLQQNGVGVRVRLGSKWNCAVFGSETIVRDAVDVYVARGATAAAVSDCAGASLRGYPSEAFLDTAPSGASP